MGNVIIGGGSGATPFAESTLGFFVGEWRARLGDSLTPYLWTDDEITGYANDAIAELCLEFPTLEDSSTTSIVAVTMTTGQSAVAISPRVTAVHSARMASGGMPLSIKTVYEMDAEQYNWRSQANGTPLVFGLNPSSDGTGFIYPPTDADDTLYLVVNRLPVSDMVYATDQNNVIGIPSRFHRLLIDGVLYRAYQKNDVDTADSAKSKMHWELWLKAKETIKRSLVKYRHTDQTVRVMTGFA